MLRTGSYGAVLSNVGARVGALVSLGVATALVAWTGGPTAVGVYTLARVLPGLVGVVMSSGLPGAVPYFLAGVDRNRATPIDHRHLAEASLLVGTQELLEGLPRSVAATKPLEQPRTVGGLRNRLCRDRPDPRLGPGHDGSDREPVGLNGDAELPGPRVPGNDGVSPAPHAHHPAAPRPI